ncbi:unnamed protein product, partial [Callosobruchus maculatus]
RPGAGKEDKALAGEGEYDEDAAIPGGKRGAAAGVGAKPKAAAGGRSGAGPEGKALAGESDYEEDAGKLGAKKGAAAGVGAKPKAAAGGRPGAGPEGKAAAGGRSGAGPEDKALAGESDYEEDAGKPGGKKGAAAGVGAKPKAAAGGRLGAGPEGRALAGESDYEEDAGIPGGKKGAAAGVGAKPKAAAGGRLNASPEGRALAGESAYEEDAGKPGGKKGAAAGVGAKTKDTAGSRPGAGPEGRPLAGEGGAGGRSGGTPEGETPDEAGGRKGAGAAAGGKPKGAPGRGPQDDEKEDVSTKPGRGTGVGAGPGGKPHDGGAGGRRGGRPGGGPEGTALAAEGLHEEGDAEPGRKKVAGGKPSGAAGGRPGAGKEGAALPGETVSDARPKAATGALSDGQAEGPYDEGAKKTAGAGKPKGTTQGRGLPGEGTEEDGDSKAMKGPGAGTKAVAGGKPGVGAGGKPEDGAEGAAKKAGVPGRAGPGDQMGAKDGGRLAGTPRDQEGTTSPDEDDGLQRSPDGTKVADGKKGTGEPVGKKPISVISDAPKDRDRATLEKRIASEKEPQLKQRLTKELQQGRGVSSADVLEPSGGPRDQARRTSDLQPVMEKAKKGPEDIPVADIPSDIKGDKAKEKAYLEKKMAAEKDPAERERLKKQVEKTKHEEGQEPAGDIPEDIKGDKAKEKAYLEKKMGAAKDPAERERLKKQLEKAKQEEGQEPAGDIPQDIKGDKAKEKAYLEKKIAAAKDPAERERLKKQLERAKQEEGQEPAGDIPDDIKGDKAKEKAYLEKKMAAAKDPAERERLKKQLERATQEEGQEPGGDIPDDIKGDTAKEKAYLEKKMAAAKDPAERERLKKQLEKAKQEEGQEPAGDIPEDIKGDKAKERAYLEKKMAATKDPAERERLKKQLEKAKQGEGQEPAGDIPEDIKGDKAKERAYLEKKMAAAKDPAERERLQKQLEKAKQEKGQEPAGDIPEDIKGDKAKERAYLEKKMAAAKDPAELERLKKRLEKAKQEEGQEPAGDIPEDIKGDKAKERAYLEKKMAATKDPAERERLKKQLEKAKQGEGQEPAGDIPEDIKGDKAKERAYLEKKMAAAKDPAERERLQKQLEKAKQEKGQEPAGDIPEDIKGDKAKERAYLEKKMAAAKDPAERERVKKQLEKARQEEGQEPAGDIPEDIKEDKAKERAYLEKQLAAAKDPAERERLRKQLEKLKQEQAQEPSGDIPEDIRRDKAKEKAYLEKKLAEEQDPKQVEELRRKLAQMQASEGLYIPDAALYIPDDVKGDKKKEKEYLESRLSAIKDPIERERLRRQLEKERGISLMTPGALLDEKLSKIEDPKERARIKEEMLKDKAKALSDVPDDIKGDEAKERAYFEKKLAEIEDPKERELLRKQLEKEKGISLRAPGEGGIDELGIPECIEDDLGRTKSFLEEKLAKVKDPKERERLIKQIEKQRGISLASLEDKAAAMMSDMPSDIKGDKEKERAYLESKLATVKDPVERERLKKLLEKEKGISLKTPDEKAQEMISVIPPGIKGDPAKEKAYFDQMLADVKDPEERERLRKSLEKQRGILLTTPEEKAQDIMSDIPDDIRGDKVKEKAYLEKMLAEVKDPEEREKLRSQLEKESGLTVETPEEKARGLTSGIPDDIKGDTEKEKAYLESQLAEIKDPEQRERLRKLLEKEKGILLSPADERAKEILLDMPDDIKGDKKKEKAYLEKMLSEVKDPKERERLRKSLERASGISLTTPMDKVKELIGDIKRKSERASKILLDIPDDIKRDKEKEKAYLEQKLAGTADPLERQRLKEEVEKQTGMTLLSPEEKAEELMSDIPDDIKGDKEKEKEFLENELAQIQDPVERERLKKLLEEEKGIRLEVMDQKLKDILSEVPEDIKGDKDKELEYLKSKLAEIEDPGERERLQKQLDEKLAGDILSDMPDDIKGDKDKERAYLESKLVEIEDTVERERLKKLLEKMKRMSLEVPDEKMEELLSEIPDDIKGDKEKERAFLESKIAEISDPEERQRLMEQLDRQRMKDLLAEIPDDIKGDKEKERDFLEGKLAEISDPVERRRLKDQLDMQAMKDILAEMPDDVRGDRSKEIAYLKSKLAEITDPAERERIRKLLEEDEGLLIETADETLEDLLSAIPDSIKGDQEKERAFLESKLAEIKDPIERERLRKLLEAETGISLEHLPVSLEEFLSQIPDDIKGDKEKERAFLESKLASIEDPIQREILKQQMADQLMKDMLDGMPDDIKGDKEKMRAYLEAKLAEITDPIERERLRKMLEKEKGISLEVIDDRLKDLLDSIPDDIKGDPNKEMEYLESKLAEIKDPAEREMLKQQLQRLKDKEKLEELFGQIPDDIKGDKEKERAFLESKLAEIADPAERERLRRLLDKETLNDTFADMPDDIKGDKAKEKAYLESMLTNVKDPGERERLLKLLEEMGIYLDVPDEKFQELLESIPDDIRGDKEKERAYLESKLAKIEDPIERERMRKQLDKERLKDLLAEVPDDIRGDKDKERAFLEGMLAKIEDPEERERLRQLLDEERMKDILSGMPDSIRGDPEKERAYLERMLAEIKDPVERERLRKLLELQRGISLESPDEKLQRLLAGMPDDIKGDKAKERAWLESQLAGITDPVERARLIKLYEAGEPGKKKPCRGVCKGGEPKLSPEELLQNILSRMPSDIKGDGEKERAYFESILAGIIDPEERARLKKLFDESQAARKKPCKGICGTVSRATPEELLQNILSSMPPGMRGNREKERAYFESALAGIGDPVEQARLRKMFNERATPEDLLQSALSVMPPGIRGDREKEAAYFQNILSGISDPYDRERLRRLLDETRFERKKPCSGVCGSKQTPEDFLQSTLSNMPDEIRGDRLKERDYFENVLARTAGPWEQAQLRKLYDAKQIERRKPCPTVCGMTPQQLPTTSYIPDTEVTIGEISRPMDLPQSTLLEAKQPKSKRPCPTVCGMTAQQAPIGYIPDTARTIGEISMPMDLPQSALLEAKQPETKRPCPGVCGQRSTPEGQLQKILANMPSEIRGDRDRERAYFENVLAGVKDPIERANLRILFNDRPAPEDLLQSMLSEIPPEVRGDKEKERAFFERCLSGIADPLLQDQLSRLYDAQERKIPCPGVCGMSTVKRLIPDAPKESEIIPFPEERTDDRPREIADPVFDEQESQSKRPCPGICGTGTKDRRTPKEVLGRTGPLETASRGMDQRRTAVDILLDAKQFEEKRPCTAVCGIETEPEDLLQNILATMPSDIKGDPLKERAYFESMLSKISDPVANAQLRKLFDARELERKWPCSAPCSMGADQRQTPEERAYIEGIISGIANQVEQERKPCKSICAGDDMLADRSLRKTSGVVALRDPSMPGPSGMKSPRHICGATIKVEDRCAALIRQAQQRSAALAALSGGVVVLPKSSTRSPGDLIPRGYLPGAALPEVIPPAYTQAVPPWLQQSNQTCQASCSECPTSQADLKSPTAKRVSIYIETEDLTEKKATSTETRAMVDDLVTNATGTETDRVLLKDAEEGTDTVRPQLEVAWKKENYEASSVSDFENVICRTVSETVSRDLNVDLKELAKRGLKICKADCASCVTAPKLTKTEEAVGSSSIEIRSQGVQSGRSADQSSSESYGTAVECTSSAPDAGGGKTTDTPEPSSGSDEPLMHPEGDEPAGSMGDEPESPLDEEPRDEPPSGMDDESGSPLDEEPKDELPSSMDDQSGLPADEQPEVSEQPSVVETTVDIVEEPIPEEAEEKIQEEQEIFVDTEATVLEEKLISDESELEEHEAKEVYETADTDETDSVGPKKESEDKSVHFEEVGPENLVAKEVEKQLDEQIIQSREEVLSKEEIPRAISIDAGETITDVSLPSETRMSTTVQGTSTQVKSSETISTPAQTAICQPHAEQARLITYLDSSSSVRQPRPRYISKQSEVDNEYKKPIVQVHETVATEEPIKQHVAIDTNDEVTQVTEQGLEDESVPKKFICRAPCSNKGMLGKLVDRICRGPCAISPTPGPSGYKPKSPRRAPCAVPCKAPCAAEEVQTTESVQTHSVCKAPCATQTLPCPGVSQACQSAISSGVFEVAQTVPQSSKSQVCQSESSTYTNATDISRVTDSVAESLPDDSSLISCSCQADLSEPTPIKVSRTCQASCSHISRGNQMCVFKDQYSNVCSCSCQASCTSAERSTSPTTETGTSTAPHVCGARSLSPTVPDKRHFGVGPSEPSKHVCAARRALGQTAQVCGASWAPDSAEVQTAPVFEVSRATTSSARPQTARGTNPPQSRHVCAAKLSRERSMSPHVFKASHSPCSSRHICSCKACLEDGGAKRKLYPIKDNTVYRVTVPDPLKALQKATVKKYDSEEKDVAKKLRKDKRYIKRATCTCDCWKKSGNEECRCMERRYRDPKDSSKFIVGCDCKDCTCGCRDGRSNDDKDGPSDDNSRRKRRCQAMRKARSDDQEDLSILMIHKDAEIVALRNALRAKESYCAEQRKIAAAAIEQLENIKSIVEERDDLRKKLETSQNELEDLKKNVALGRPYGLDLQHEEKVCHVPFLDESTSGSPVREEEIVQLEQEISNMRSGNLTPELEAKVIRKEVEVLKRYCSKLSVIQKESSHLKAELTKYKDQMAKLGLCGDTTEINDLRYKLSSLNDTIKERNDLKQRVKHLEKALSQYTDLPEDVEVFKQRSLLLDEVLQDRDRLSRRVEQVRGIEDEVYNLRKKAARVDELEENLTMANKQNKLLEDELEHARCKCSYAEIDALNSKAEGDTLRSKLVCMEHEMEMLRSQNKDRERLKQERDHLKKSLDELARMQSDFDHMKHQMKSLEVLKAERDMFKSKYENLIGLECECDILRSQVERAKLIEKERDTLESQVEDLETCISDQENEIRRLVCHIDALAQKDNQQEKLKDLIASMREEMDTKSALLLASEEKLATMQCQFKTSFEDVRTESSQLRLQKEHLEKEIEMIKRRNTFLEQEVCCLKCANDMLVKKMEDTEEYIGRLHRALKESDSRAQRSILSERYHQLDAISTMR